MIRFDLSGYRMVLSNLLSNGIKYTREGGVDLSLSVGASRAVLRVEDTGIGIPKQDIPRMFEEFFRASNVRAGPIRGTGVGLGGVRELVNRFGGEIELASEEGKGTAFTTRFPIHGEEEGPGGRAPGSP